MSDDVKRLADQPDWDRLARETLYSRDDWIAAAMYLGDLDWRTLWPSVEAFVHGAGFSPIGAARAVRGTLSQPSLLPGQSPTARPASPPPAAEMGGEG